MLDLKEFGKRVQAIREEVLQLSQVEMANALVTNQVMVSRLENGLGAHIELLFKFVNYLNQNNYPGHRVFITPFSIESIKKQGKKETNSKKTGSQILKKLNELKNNNQKEQQLLADIVAMMGE